MSDCSRSAFKVPKQEIKPCPFCGAKVEVFQEDKRNWVVNCNAHKGGCGAAAGVRRTKQEAIEAWNTRYQPTCKWTINEQAIRGDFDAITECGHVYSFSECPVPDYCASCGGRVEAVD